MRRLSTLTRGLTLDGRYRLRERVGEGSMAEVWAADDILGAASEPDGAPPIVAIKVMNGLLASSSRACERFAREVEAVGRIAHPSVVRLLGHGALNDGRAFLVMEYVSGETLEAYLQRSGLLGAHSAVALGRRVLEGLSAAHAVGIVHRDLKPANIVLSSAGAGPRQVKLVDFGVARVIDGSGDDEARLTTTGSMLGSPRYMPIEMARGESDIDARADIFATGAVMYHALTGRPPFDGAGVGQYQAIMNHDVVPLAEARPDLPPELVALVERAMAQRRDDRYASADEMLEELRPLERALAADG